MSKETIEEATDRIREEYPFWFEDNSFGLGAAWQAERMYSEEEVLQMVDNYRHHFELYRNIQVLPDMFFEWFDQNKKQKS